MTNPTATTPTAASYQVDFGKVLQRLLAAGGEIALQTQLAMQAVALEDAHARIADLEAAQAGAAAADEDTAATD